MLTANSLNLSIRPPVTNPRISLLSIHLLHRVPVPPTTPSPFSPLSIISFRKLPLCRLSAPLYIASTDTVL